MGRPQCSCSCRPHHPPPHAHTPPPPHTHSTGADRREAQYEAQGLGSMYLFRLDRDRVVDATNAVSGPARHRAKLRSHGRKAAHWAEAGAAVARGGKGYAFWDGATADKLACLLVWRSARSRPLHGQAAYSGIYAAAASPRCPPPLTGQLRALHQPLLRAQLLHGDSCGHPLRCHVSAHPAARSGTAGRPGPPTCACSQAKQAHTNRAACPLPFCPAGPPPAAGQRSIGIFAKRDIAQGEELTYHYLVRGCLFSLSSQSLPSFILLWVLC